MKRFVSLFLLGCLPACHGVIDSKGNLGSGGANGALGPGGLGSPGSGGATNVAGSGNPGDPGVAMLPGGLTLEGKPLYYRVVRLTHEQWENAAQQTLLLEAASGLSSGFVPDPPNGKFSNNERALFVTDTLHTDYQRAAEALAASVSHDAAALARLGNPGDSAGFVRSLGRRAYRRALTAAEEQKYATLFAAGAGFLASGDAFQDGAQVVIEALLQSPHFLYRLELSPEGARLSGSELATKLALLLQSSTPDDALLTSAESGALDTPAGLLAAAEQMLAQAAAQRVLERFHTELFGLHRYRSILKDTSLFPSYSESLNDSLLQADLMFFDRVFSGGKGLREILSSPVAYVSQATAGFYGVSAPGPGLSEVILDASRPGFLTRLGFLAYNATLRDPDPIHRGVDINNRVLCAKLEPPAGEIPPLPQPVPGQTNRERVAAHTGSGVCVGCHGNVINPLGFALEGFDAMGQARATDNGKPVDTKGEYAFTDGLKAFGNISELVGLMTESQQAHGCYAANLTEFALARDLAGGDGELVTDLQQASLNDDRSIKASLLTMLGSTLFTHAKGGAK